MAYTDSARDYTWEIISLSADHGSMTVKYDTADSLDEKPSIFRRFVVGLDQFNESDLTLIATNKYLERSVVAQWGVIESAQDATIGFNADSFIGNVYNNRYKVIIESDVPAPGDSYNQLLFKAIPYDVEDSDTVTVLYNIVAMDSDEKVAMRNSLRTSRRDLWELLDSEGHRDSFVQLLSLNDSADTWSSLTLDFLSTESVPFGDPIVQLAQQVLEWDDSTMADWMPEYEREE